MEGVTARPAATLIVLRPGASGPEVLMLERPARGFFGGLWVFPGGALEPIDRGDTARRAVSMPSGADDLAWRAAALRETVEEVGLALTRPTSRAPLDAMGQAVFEAVLDRGAVLDGRGLRLLSQWVTPQGLPTRFDARFYLAVSERPAELLMRSDEVVDVAWVTAEEGLQRVEREEWAMARPTIHHLRWLCGHADLEEIWEASQRSVAPRVEPVIESDGSEVWVRLPAAADLP